LTKIVKTDVSLTLKEIMPFRLNVYIHKEQNRELQVISTVSAYKQSQQKKETINM